MEKAKQLTVRVPKWNISGVERVAIWRRAQVALKKKAPAMLKELRKMRREWQ